VAILPHGVSLGPLAQESLGTAGGFPPPWAAARVGSGREPAATLPPVNRDPSGRLPLVLAVDDEEHITELVAMALGYNGFEVERAASGRAALDAVERRRPDLIVLDVMLPDLDGFEVARRLRQSEGAGTRVPVIFLTARDTTADKVEGLRLGTDDYVTKPFSIEELVERVRAVLRRSTGSTPGEHRLTYADLELDEETRDVWRAGQLVELTPTEFKLLHYLLLNARRVLTREQILEHVWDYTFAGNASVLETYVSYLRHKIDTVDPPLIHTVRGVGYSLRLPRDQAG
jgi:two-component system, OmpR family, response regulator